MDFDGLQALLRRIHRGELQLLARDTPEPSVFAHGILNAKPYAFLDDAPLEERRAHAVQTRRARDSQSVDEASLLDLAAVEKVRHEAFPDPRDADELHDALMTCGLLTMTELGSFDAAWLNELVEAGRRPGEPATRAERIAVAVAAARAGRASSRAVDPAVTIPASRAAHAWTAGPPRSSWCEPADDRRTDHRRRPRGDAGRSGRSDRNGVAALGAKAWCCAAGSRRTVPRARSNGATGAARAASIATPSTGCEPRSSPAGRFHALSLPLRSRGRRAA
jgi:ATP-dependent Lhr-like helicase